MGNVVRWSEEQLAAHRQRAAVSTPPRKEEKAPDSMKTQPLPVAIGAERDQGMNKTEAEYAVMLEERKARREIAWWKYEAITFKLADDTRYTPDFAVMLADGSLEIAEIKGRKGDSYYCTDDAKVKIKVAAALFPMRFFIVWPSKSGGWNREAV